MPRYDLAARSGVIVEFKEESPWQRRRRRKWETRCVMPEDKEWQIALCFAVLFISFCVLFVRWWLCV